ncbi:DMT family transporter [Streptomyces sp. cg36]|uniref:DMT family transporter n=1 Tax=Streptomyces sp. cg36 TaxID=3238798 RepID=UPI0034E1F1F5
MDTFLAVLFAVLAALSNALGTVLQRVSARSVSHADSFSWRLIRDLLRHPVWFGGFAAVLCAGACQAVALVLGSLALVQPVFVLELPFALLIGAAVFRHRPPRHALPAAAAMAAGTALALTAARPVPGTDSPSAFVWVLTLVAAGGLMATATAAALARPRGMARAALFGLAAAIGYALTAALLKDAADAFSAHGPAAFFTTWQTYAFAASGGCALFLLSNAMESGPIVASQPALTLGDATVSLALGITVFGEHVRTGWWLIPEVAGILLVVLSALVLSKVTPPPNPESADPAHSADPASSRPTPPAAPAPHETRSPGDD